MNPLFLLLLVGGAVAAFAAKGSGAARGHEDDEVWHPRLLKGCPVRSYPPVTSEKFADALYFCFGRYQDAPTAETPAPTYLIGPAPRSPGLNHALHRLFTMNDQQPDVLIGYEYLAHVPNNAHDRVAAIRAKVNAHKAGVDPRSFLMEKMTISSREKLSAFADSFVNTYKNLAANKDQAKEFAEAAGVPMEDVEREISSFMSSVASTDTLQLVDKAIKDYGPIASTIVKGVSKVIEITSAGGSAEGKVAASLDVLAMAALVIPVYGAIVSLVLSFVSGILKDAEAKKDESCNRAKSYSFSRLNALLEKGVVVPWHYSTYFDQNICASGGPGRGMLEAESLFQRLIDQGIGVDPNDGQLSSAVYDGEISSLYRATTKKWWALAQLFMSEPRVFTVFNALGRDASGGGVASDEQVMLVAAPYAVANGFDVDEFAEELWKRSGGWRSAPGTNRMLAKVRDDAGRFWRYPGDQIWGVLEPDNSWLLQWGVLSVAAEEIVAEWLVCKADRVHLVDVPAEKFDGIVRTDAAPTADISAGLFGGSLRS